MFQRNNNIIRRNMNTRIITIALLVLPVISFSQKTKSYGLTSPDAKIKISIAVGDKLQWSVQQSGQQLILPSDISLQLSDEVLGEQAKVISAPTEKVNTSFKTFNYKKATINDQYNQLTLNCRGDYGVIFRAYNDAVAYRFFTKKKGEIIVKNEEANFNFTADYKSFIPIQWDYRDGKTFNSSFEALYHEITFSQFPKDSLAFLPILVDIGENKKVAIMEADLEDYPGMYLDINSTGKGFKGVYAPYPLEAHQVGINYIPTKRADYIAKSTGPRSFPWRVMVVSERDKDLLNQDIIQKLASPPRLSDFSWVKPGQVAWDWWSSMNIKNVNFKAGLNTPTYKYYIDFAVANKIPYIILDGGWSDELDLFKVSPNINLQEIIDYGKQKGVDVILWASWRAITLQMEKAFPLYSQMGIKGFKIDFIDRDDQIAVESTYEIAKKAAEYKLMVDYHGAFKPTGLQRTYPNVMGYEGVKGLENYKWADEDQPRYTVTIPFIRMMAGPMDYTPGAMRNVNQANYRPIANNPMSKGTRCNQLAMYAVFDAPLQMLSDNPSIYMQEKDCTDFITKVPTTFDETVPLDGKVGEYVAVCRRKGNTWFAGAMTNWNARELTLDFSFLPKGSYEAVIFKDGTNADRDGTDYVKEIVKLNPAEPLKVRLSRGGGWAARIYPVK